MRRRFWAGIVVAIAITTIAPVFPGAAPAGAAPTTTVSLTFDDGVAAQSIAEAAMDAHGMHGTFYVNTNTIDTGGYLSWAQLTQFAANGHEIGGHTLDHLDLTMIPAAQAQTQVCQDRQNLLNHGFAATDFAYPYGDGYGTASVRAIVQGCGYSSARRAWGLYSSAPECGNDGCGYPYAATIPPGDIWGIPTPDNPQTATTLAEIETEVTQVEQHGGGWAPIVFHEICDGCDPYSVTSATFSAFLDWLQTRVASGNVVVKTMAQALGNAPSDTTAPTSSISCNGAACTSNFYAPSVQVSLSAADDPGGSGVAAIRYTTDGSTPSPSSTAYSGPFTLPSTKTVKFRAYDVAGNAEATKTQVMKIDATAPASSIACNGGSCSGGWYNAPVQLSLAASDPGGSGVAAIRYTTDGSDPTPSSTLYSAPFSVSSSTAVKFRATDNVGNIEPTETAAVSIDAVAPASSIACNGASCSSDWFHAPVNVSLTATDNASGVAAIRYTTDGSDPTAASAAYGAPFISSATTTVKYRAYDIAGDVETTNTRVVQIDTVAPTSSIACNGVGCSNNWYSAGVHIALSAKDTGGSGVASIRYTTDGSTPTPASPLYSTPFAVTASKTLKYRAFDTAGNAGAVTSQLVRIDKTKPTETLLVPASFGAAGAGIKITAKVADSRIRYRPRGLLRRRAAHGTGHHFAVFVRLESEEQDGLALVDGGRRRPRRQPHFQGDRAHAPLAERSTVASCNTTVSSPSICRPS